MAERGVTVSYEALRNWFIKFDAKYFRQLTQKHRKFGDTFYIDEVFVKINRKQHYLWPAEDQNAELVDVYLQTRSDGATAKRFFKRSLRSLSYAFTPREVIPFTTSNLLAPYWALSAILGDISCPYARLILNRKR